MSEAKFRCDACGKAFRWKPQIAGKQTRCKCGALLTIPDAPESGSPPRESDDGTIPLAESPNAVAYAAQASAADSPSSARKRTKCVNCNAPLAPGAIICVRCGTNQNDGQRTITATGETFVADADDFDARSLGDIPRNNERERTRRLSYGDDAESAFASRGMVCIELGLWAALLSIACTAVGVAMSVANLFVDVDLAILLAVSAVASAALNLGAIVLMLFVPKAAGARWLLVTALGCLLGSVVATLFTTGIWDTSFSGLALALGSMVLSFLAVIFFLVFLKQLADFFEFGEVSQQADKVISLYIALTIGQFAACIPLMFILIAILAAYTFWMYVQLLLDLYRAARYRRQHGTH
ncbi:MAG: hypothetical protein AAGF84_02440 [Planctomycetota bacterium]